MALVFAASSDFVTIVLLRPGRFVICLWFAGVCLLLFAIVGSCLVDICCCVDCDL